MFRSVCIVISFLLALHYALAFEKLKEQLDKIRNHQDEELLKLPKEEYNMGVARKQGKLMFDYMDTNKDGFVNREEMRVFGKIIFSDQDVEVDFWIRENFKNDENKDDILNFEEFFKPQIDLGETTEPHLNRDEL
eukprot:gene10906-12065_t